jgi:hypothetical protein
MKSVYGEAKGLLEKARERPSGMRFRQEVHTIYIHSGCTGGSVMDVLGCLKRGEPRREM